MDSSSFAEPSLGKTERRVPPSDPWIGRTLKKYAIVAPIGRGGMGVVYIAEDVMLKRVVAVKRIADAVTHESKGLQRFLREARAAATLQHGNVVAIYDIDQEQGAHYLVMEFVPGPSAQQIIDREGALPWRAAVQIVTDACRGLCAAHAARLIHRDIKPANLLVSRSGDVKLGDFGLAKSASDDQTALSQSGVLVGTPQFMSPEQAKNEDLDERSDIYSLGATLYALLTGTSPFTGRDAYSVLYAHATQPVPDPRQKVAAVPEACVQIIQRAMAKRRGDRYADAAEMLAELEKTLGPQREPLGLLAEKFELPARADTTIVSPAPPDLARPSPNWRRIGVVAALLVCLAIGFVGVLACAGVAVHYWINRPDDRVADAPVSPDKLKQQLIALNPAFNGDFTAVRGKDDRIVKLSLVVDQIEDIGPLGALTDLEELELYASEGRKTKLTDVKVLGQLTKLTKLRVSAPVKDFECLRKLKGITELSLSGANIDDLSVLSELPLARLRVGATKITSFKGLENCPLEDIDAAFAYFLTSLEGLPTKKLRRLSIASTKVPNLAGLEKASELREFDFHWTEATDKERPVEKTGRSIAPDDLKVLLQLTKLESLTAELVTPAEEEALRKAQGPALKIKRVPPGKKQ